MTVTLCGAAQLSGVKIRLAGDTIPSPVLLDVRGTVTSCVGCWLSRTEKLALPPASVVTSPAVGLTVIPA